MKRILGVLLAGVLLLSGCGQWQKSQKESVKRIATTEAHSSGFQLFVNS